LGSVSWRGCGFGLLGVRRRLRVLLAVLPRCRVPLRQSCRANPICLQGVSPKGAQIARFSCLSSQFKLRRVRKTDQKSMHGCENQRGAKLVTIVALTESIRLSAVSIVPKSILKSQPTAQTNRINRISNISKINWRSRYSVWIRTNVSMDYIE